MKERYYSNKMFCFYFILLVCYAVNLTGCVRSTTGDFKRDNNRLLSISVKAGIEYMKEGDTDNAHRHLRNALTLDGKSAEAHNAIALLYQYEGDFNLAQKHFKLALKYGRRSAKVLNNYGTLLFTQRRFQESIELLEEAALDAQYESRFLVYDNIGRCALQLKDYGRAQSAFEKALRLNPESTRPLLELAQISFEKRDYNLTSNYLAEYNRLTRGSARSLWLGIRLERIQGDENALASYELALKNLFPKSQEFKRYEESLVK